MIFNYSECQIKRSAPAWRFSNFFATDGLSVADIPLCHIYHVGIVRSTSLADTFGAFSGATAGTSVLGFEVLTSATVRNTCSCNGLTGGPGLLDLVLGLFKELLAD